jgi:hypothetical protein
MAIGAAFTQAEATVKAVVELEGEDRFVIGLMTSTTLIDSQHDVANNLSITCTLCGGHMVVGPILNVDRLRDISEFAETHQCTD